MPLKQNEDDLKNFHPSDFGIFNDDGSEEGDLEIGEMSEDYHKTPLIPQEDIPEAEEDTGAEY